MPSADLLDAVIVKNQVSGALERVTSQAAAKAKAPARAKRAASAGR